MVSLLSRISKQSTDRVFFFSLVCSGYMLFLYPDTVGSTSMLSVPMQKLKVKYQMSFSADN